MWILKTHSYDLCSYPSKRKDYITELLKQENEILQGKGGAMAQWQGTGFANTRLISSSQLACSFRGLGKPVSVMSRLCVHATGQADCTPRKAREIFGPPLYLVQKCIALAGKAVYTAWVLILIRGMVQQLPRGYRTFGFS